MWFVLFVVEVFIRGCGIVGFRFRRVVDAGGRGSDGVVGYINNNIRLFDVRRLAFGTARERNPVRYLRCRIVVFVGESGVRIVGGRNLLVVVEPSVESGIRLRRLRFEVVVRPWWLEIIGSTVAELYPSFSLYFGIGFERRI